MKVNRNINIILLGLFVFLANSCTSNLDFNQANTIVVEPVVVSNLASFEMQASSFNVGGVEQPSLGAFSNFDVFSDPNLIRHVLEADFYFEIDNGIRRDFTIDINFLDDKDALLYTISFGVPANTSAFKYTIPFRGANLSLLEQTRKLAFVIHLNPGTPVLTSTSTEILKLRSSLTAYLKVK